MKVTVCDIVFKVFLANCGCDKLVIGDKCDCVSLSGVVAEVHIHTVPPLDRNTEEQLARCLTAGNKYEDIVTTLLRRYKMARHDIHRSDVEHCIERRFQKALIDVCTVCCTLDQLSHAAKLLTVLAQCGLLVKLAVVASSIIMQCKVMTVEALSDSGQLSQLFSDTFSKFANTKVIATVSWSSEEYDKVLKLLTPTAGNSQLIITFICCIHVLIRK